MADDMARAVRAGGQDRPAHCEHAVCPTVVRAAGAILGGSAPEVAQRHDQRVVHVLFEVGRERRERIG